MFAIKNSTANPSQIAGFWRRLFAFMLDGAVLGIIGLFLGYFLYDYFASVGVWGKTIGFVIALSYFGIMNSYIFGGQTLGKMAKKIKVVSINGTPLSVTASFFRSSIFCAPFFLNGAIPNVDFLNSWLQSTLSSLVFGVGLSIVYLFIFNRKTRQSLHDLAVGSYVVRVGLETVPLPTSCIWRGHIAVVVMLCTLAMGLPIFTERFVATEPFISLLPLQKALANEPGIKNFTLEFGTNPFPNVQKGTQPTSYLTINVVNYSKDIDQEALANRIAQIVLATSEAANQKDFITVSFHYGYDIGIGSAWKTNGFSHSPTEWRERLTLNDQGHR